MRDKRRQQLQPETVRTSTPGHQCTDWPTDRRNISYIHSHATIKSATKSYQGISFTFFIDFLLHPILHWFISVIVCFFIHSFIHFLFQSIIHSFLKFIHQILIYLFIHLDNHPFFIHESPLLAWFWFGRDHLFLAWTHNFLQPLSPKIRFFDPDLDLAGGDQSDISLQNSKKSSKKSVVSQSF